MLLLYTSKNLYCALVIKRATTCPYVLVYSIHTLCGFVNKGSALYMTKNQAGTILCSICMVPMHKILTTSLT